jgi:hypothetical protein
MPVREERERIQLLCELGGGIRSASAAREVHHWMTWAHHPSDRLVSGPELPTHLVKPAEVRSSRKLGNINIFFARRTFHDRAVSSPGVGFGISRVTLRFSQHPRPAATTPDRSHGPPWYQRMLRIEPDDVDGLSERFTNRWNRILVDGMFAKGAGREASKPRATRGSKAAKTFMRR